ncbi:MAG: hypothetical protein K0R00_668 [Herbinix sp.]|jgi:hypothetical protein|nr:hypothetical protein [Herbinix sp.]
MANNIVAYIGIENFDYILYLARILSKLDRKVLILESSNSKAFEYVFPSVNGINVNKEPVTYRHLDYGKFPLTDDIINVYDDILISYGMNGDVSEYCTRVTIVSDPFLHNLATTKNMISQLLCKDKTVLIRNMISTNYGSKNISNELEGLIEKDKIDFVYLDESNLANAIRCVSEQSVVFVAINKELQSYLLKVAGMHYPDLKEKKLREAYKAARKGD